MWTCWSWRSYQRPRVGKGNGRGVVYDWEEQNLGACWHTLR